MNTNMHPEWNLLLLRGVIDDGEPERHVGDVFDWPITFWSHTVLTAAVETTKNALALANNYYRVNAEVIYISQDPTQKACILDFSIKAISEFGGLLAIPLPAGCKEGDYVCGDIRLELALCTAAHPHNLIRRWRVNRIYADLTNFQLTPGDISRVRYQEVSGTDAIRAGSYILHSSTTDL